MKTTKTTKKIATKLTYDEIDLPFNEYISLLDNSSSQDDNNKKKNEKLPPDVPASLSPDPESLPDENGLEWMTLQVAIDPTVYTSANYIPSPDLANITQTDTITQDSAPLEHITLDASHPALKPQCKTTLKNCKAANPMYCPYHGAKLISLDIEQTLTKMGLKGKVNVTKIQSGAKPVFQLKIGVSPKYKEKAISILNDFLNQPGVTSWNNTWYPTPTMKNFDLDVDLMDSTPSSEMAKRIAKKMGIKVPEGNEGNNAPEPTKEYPQPAEKKVKPPTSPKTPENKPQEPQEPKGGVSTPLKPQTPQEGPNAPIPATPKYDTSKWYSTEAVITSILGADAWSSIEKALEKKDQLYVMGKKPGYDSPSSLGTALGKIDSEVLLLSKSSSDYWNDPKAVGNMEQLAKEAYAASEKVHSAHSDDVFAEEQKSYVTGLQDNFKDLMSKNLSSSMLNHGIDAALVKAGDELKHLAGGDAPGSWTAWVKESKGWLQAAEDALKDAASNLLSGNDKKASEAKTQSQAALQKLKELIYWADTFKEAFESAKKQAKKDKLSAEKMAKVKALSEYLSSHKKPDAKAPLTKEEKFKTARKLLQKKLEGLTAKGEGASEQAQALIALIKRYGNALAEMGSGNGQG